MTTNAELAILTLVQEQPRHGYEIEHIIQERDMREWTDIGFSSIYYILAKLEKQGLVIGRTQAPQGRGPARKVYHLTDAGAEATRRATLSLLGGPQMHPSPLQLGLSNLLNIPQDQAMAALRAHSETLYARTQYIEALAAIKQPLPFPAQAMFSHALTILEAERDWIDRFIERMEAYIP